MKLLALALIIVALLLLRRHFNYEGIEPIEYEEPEGV